MSQCLFGSTLAPALNAGAKSFTIKFHFVIGSGGKSLRDIHPEGSSCLYQGKQASELVTLKHSCSHRLLASSAPAAPRAVSVSPAISFTRRFLLVLTILLAVSPLRAAPPSAASLHTRSHPESIRGIRPVTTSSSMIRWVPLGLFGTICDLSSPPLTAKVSSTVKFLILLSSFRFLRLPHQGSRMPP